MTTYKDWKVGDKINICASIDEFCGYSSYIFSRDINVSKYPDSCSIIFGTERDCGLHLNNVTLTFKLVKCSYSANAISCTPEIVYKTLGTAKTDYNGTCGIVYTVTEQDRLDYESQIGEDIYKVMACITDPDGQATYPSAVSITSESISIIFSGEYIEISNVLLCAGVISLGVSLGYILYKGISKD